MMGRGIWCFELRLKIVLLPRLLLYGDIFLAKRGAALNETSFKMRKKVEKMKSERFKKKKKKKISFPYMKSIVDD